MTTELSPRTGDKLLDIHNYAIALKGSDLREEATVGHNLLLILKGKNP